MVPVFVNFNFGFFLVRHWSAPSWYLWPLWGLRASNCEIPASRHTRRFVMQNWSLWKDLLRSDNTFITSIGKYLNSTNFLLCRCWRTPLSFFPSSPLVCDLWCRSMMIVMKWLSKVWMALNWLVTNLVLCKFLWWTESWTRTAAISLAAAGFEPECKHTTFSLFHRTFVP